MHFNAFEFNPSEWNVKSPLHLFSGAMALLSLAGVHENYYHDYWPSLASCHSKMKNWFDSFCLSRSSEWNWNEWKRSINEARICVISIPKFSNWIWCCNTHTYIHLEGIERSQPAQRHKQHSTWRAAAQKECVSVDWTNWLELCTLIFAKLLYLGCSHTPDQTCRRAVSDGGRSVVCLIVIAHRLDITSLRSFLSTLKC